MLPIAPRDGEIWGSVPYRPLVSAYHIFLAGEILSRCSTYYRLIDRNQADFSYIHSDTVVYGLQYGPRALYMFNHLPPKVPPIAPATVPSSASIPWLRAQIALYPPGLGPEPL